MLSEEVGSRNVVVDNMVASVQSLGGDVASLGSAIAGLLNEGKGCFSDCMNGNTVNA